MADSSFGDFFPSTLLLATTYAGVDFCSYFVSFRSLSVDLGVDFGVDFGVCFGVCFGVFFGDGV